MNEQVFGDRPITLFCMESLEKLCEFTLGQWYNYKNFWFSVGNFWPNTWPMGNPCQAVGHSNLTVASTLLWLWSGLNGFSLIGVGCPRKSTREVKSTLWVNVGSDNVLARPIFFGQKAIIWQTSLHLVQSCGWSTHQGLFYTFHFLVWLYTPIICPFVVWRQLRKKNKITAQIYNIQI